MYSNYATGHGECVHGGIVNDNHLDASVLKFAKFNELENEVFEVALHDWVFVYIDLASKNLEPGASDLMFVFS